MNILESVPAPYSNQQELCLPSRDLICVANAPECFLLFSTQVDAGLGISNRAVSEQLLPGVIIPDLKAGELGAVLLMYFYGQSYVRVALSGGHMAAKHGFEAELQNLGLSGEVVPIGGCVLSRETQANTYKLLGRSGDFGGCDLEALAGLLRSELPALNFLI